MTARYVVTVTDLPDELAPDGRMVIDYTADDDTPLEEIESQVRTMLPQAARHAEARGVDLSSFDPATATITAVAVG